LGKLTYFIDLRGVGLADKDVTWLHAMPVGTFKHPVYGELSFTSERLQTFADNIKNKVRKIDLDIDFDHKQDIAKGSQAAGWIKDADVKDDGLWIGVAFTDDAKAEVNAGKWRYLSPEFLDEWTDEASGTVHKDVMLGAALTNRPFLKDLLPIAASEDYIESFHPKGAELHDGYFKRNDRVRQVSGSKVGVITEIGGRAYGITWDGEKTVDRWVVDGELAPETPGKGEMFYSEDEFALAVATAILTRRGAKSGV
jgi:hypothetical protein